MVVVSPISDCIASPCSLFPVPCSLFYIINPILIRQFGIVTFRAFDKVLTWNLEVSIIQANSIILQAIMINHNNLS